MSMTGVNLVVEVIGKANLATILAMNGKLIDKTHRADVFRIVRYQFEDALASIEKRTTAQVKPPFRCELEADDKWYDEYLNGFDRELRTFAYEFKTKRKFDSVGAEQKVSGGSRDSPRGKKSPSRERRQGSRDRSESRGKDGYRQRSPLRRDSPRSRSPSSRDKEGSGRNWRDQPGRRGDDSKRGERSLGRRSRDSSRERDRKTDDDKFAEKNKSNNDADDVVIIDENDPSKPIAKSTTDGAKYGIQIGGIDSRVPQSRMNAFFTEMGVKINNVRVVFRPGASVAVAFIEFTDYALYVKAFEYQGHMLDGKFPIAIEDVAVDSINKKCIDIRRGRWFPKVRSSPIGNKTAKALPTTTTATVPPRQQAGIPGVVRPLMPLDSATTEVKKPVAVVTPGNRVVKALMSEASTTEDSSVVSSTTESVQADPGQTSSSSLDPDVSNPPSSASSSQFDALSFIERNLASAAASITNECGPPRIRIESAPVDVTTKDVEDYFRKRQLPCERIDIRREMEDTASGLVGKVNVVVTFKGQDDCSEALKMTDELKGSKVVMRREGVSGSDTNVANLGRVSSTTSCHESTANSGNAP